MKYIVNEMGNVKSTSFIDINTGTRKLTGFGREYEYLTGKGYVYDEISKKMIK